MLLGQQGNQIFAFDYLLAIIVVDKILGVGH